MLKVDVAVNNKGIKSYLGKHNHSFNSHVGWFGNKQRQEVEETKHSFGAYGLGRQKRKGKKHKVPLSNAQVAYKNVYGDGKSPARNFFKLASDSKYWQSNNFDFVKKYFTQTADVNQTLNAWNNLSKAVVRRAILDFKTPRNSATTIAKKGFNKPLIDSQQMLYGLKAIGNTHEQS